LLDPVCGGVAVVCDRKKKGRWWKNRLGSVSSRKARTEALIIVNCHFRSMTWMKMASSLEASPAIKSGIRMKIETGMRRLRHNILAGPAAAEHALPDGRTRSRARFNSRRPIQGEGDCH
jgi:hypothetical protein